MSKPPKPSQTGFIHIAQELGINLSSDDAPIVVAAIHRAYGTGCRDGAAAEREACAKVCEEMHDHYSALKDTALLNGDVDLSNASSGEPRACEFLATAIRQRGAK